MLHRARRKEESALEEAVVQAVQKSGCDGEGRTDADAHDHVANLADGGEGQHALQIGLHHGVHYADHHGDGAGPHHDFSPRCRPGSEAVHSCGEVHAGLYVTGSMQQGADGSGSGHRFGDPRMQRELDGFGRQRYQHEDEDAAGEGSRNCRIGPQSTAGSAVDDEDGDEQSIARQVRHQQDLARACDGFLILYQKPTSEKEQSPINSQQR